MQFLEIHTILVKFIAARYLRASVDRAFGICHASPTFLILNRNPLSSRCGGKELA